MSEVLTPEELGRLVTVPSNLLGLPDGTSLDEDLAVQTILSRFGYPLDIALKESGSYEKLLDVNGREVESDILFERYAGGKVPIMESLARTIVKSLPSEALTDTVLLNLDLSPYLEAMKGRSISVKVRKTGPDFSIPVQIGEERADELSRVYTQLNTARTNAETATSEGQQLDGATTQSTNGFEQIANMGMMEEGLTEDQVRIIFTQSMSDDIYDIVSIVGEADNTRGMIAVGESPFAALAPIPVQPTEQHYRRAGLSGTGAMYNWRALGDYLIKGQVTPSEIRILQRKMVAAGLFDQMPDGFEPGDAVDRNTNTAWRALLAETYRRKVPLDVALKQLTNERRRNLPQLRDPMAKSAMNYVVQNIIGRNLTDSEMTELQSYLIEIRDREGLAAAGIEPEMGFTEVGVSQFVQTELSGEVRDVQRAGALDNYKAAMEAL